MPEPSGVDLIAAVICSVDGGYNGLNPATRLGVTHVGGGLINYILTDPEGVVNRFTVTVTPEPEPEPDEEPEP